MRRWIKRISLGLLILIVLVLVAVQVVLWSPLPRKIAITEVEKILGLRINTAKVSISWFGHTELTDVSLGLPLDSQSFLTVKALKIKHNSLFGLAIGRSVVIDSIEIDNPDVKLVQDAQGGWNLQQVAILLAKAGGGGTVQQPQQATANAGVPRLPDLLLSQGTISVTPFGKLPVVVSPLNVQGYRDGTLVYRYDLTLGPDQPVKVTGVLAPGGNWQHQVGIELHNLDGLLKQFGVSNTYGAAVKANWSGQAGVGKVTGNLAFERVTAHALPALGDVLVGGSLDVEVAGGVITARPHAVSLRTSLPTLPDVTLQSGAIVKDATGIHAQSLKVAALGGLANLDANADPGAGSVDLKATWSGLSVAKKTVQSGSVTASLRQPFANQPVIKVELTSNGRVGDQAAEVALQSGWDALIDVTGTGTSWKSIDWVMNAPRLAYSTPGKVYNLSNLTAQVSMRTPEHQQSPVIELVDLTLPSTAVGQAPELSTTARIDLNTKQWKLRVSDRLGLEFEGSPVNFDIEVNALGDAKKYVLKQLSITMGDTTLTADGSYSIALPDAPSDQHPKDPGPMSLHVLLTQSQRQLPNAPVRGLLQGEFNIVGDLFHKDTAQLGATPDLDPGFSLRPYLDIDGDLRTQDLFVLNRSIGDIDIKVAGNTVTELGQHPHTELASTKFYLLQAPWTMSAVYPNKDNALEVNLAVSNLAVEELARVANVNGIAGQVASAKWKLLATGASLNAIDLRSEYHLTNLYAGGANADTVDARVSLHQGTISVDPVVARNGTGSLTMTASMDLAKLKHVITEITVDRWPVPITSVAQARVSAHLQQDIDLKSRFVDEHGLPGTHVGSSGTLNASLDLLLNTGVKQAQLAHGEIAAEVQNRAVDIGSISGHVLDGSFNGSAKIDVDKPLLASGRVQWQDVDAGTLVNFIPALTGLGGKFSGTITIAPAMHEPRPLEPVRIDVNVASAGGHFRSVQIGGDHLLAVHAVVYANVDRAVLSHSDIYVAGGQVGIWSRVGTKGGLSDQTMIEFSGLDLNQIAHVEPTITKDIPGVLTGQIGIIRSGPTSDKLLGFAHVNLDKTDLANFGPISALYDIMHVAGGGSSAPTGSGSVDMNFEQNTLRISNFSFFNRGIDAHGLFTVGPINYDDYHLTPVGGQVVGAARPLKDTRLPLLSDADEIFSALQRNLTTINVNGPLKNPGYEQATISEIGTAMRQLLVGEAEEGQKAP